MSSEISNAIQKLQRSASRDQHGFVLMRDGLRSYAIEQEAGTLTLKVLPPIAPLSHVVQTIRDSGLLAPMQARVAVLIACGCSNSTVAKKLGISEHTARRHTEAIFEKLNTASRDESAIIVTTLAAKLLNSRGKT
jgi:DNA-binding NarL/FixJ family response regulator